MKEPPELLLSQDDIESTCVAGFCLQKRSPALMQAASPVCTMRCSAGHPLANCHERTHASCPLPATVSKGYRVKLVLPASAVHPSRHQHNHTLPTCPSNPHSQGYRVKLVLPAAAARRFKAEMQEAGVALAAPHAAPAATATATHGTTASARLYRKTSM